MRSLAAARRFAGRFLAVTAVSALAGCATVPPPVAPGGFELVGRVAVRYGTEGATGRVTWRHDRLADDLVISSPLGQGIAEIGRRGDTYTLVTADGRRLTATDPERLTEDALGWRLPLAGLPDWVQGRPLDGVAAETRLDGTRLVELRQLGWTIEYLARDETTLLPTRMRLSREALDIRLVIEDWQTP